MDKEKKTRSYNYDSYYNSTKTKNRCKYIATCVEALIAAILSNGCLYVKKIKFQCFHI